MEEEQRQDPVEETTSESVEETTSEPPASPSEVSLNVSLLYIACSKMCMHIKSWSIKRLYMLVIFVHVCAAAVSIY